MQLWLSVLPSVVAIILAVVTKQVIPSLLIALWLGSFVLQPHLLGSVNRTIDYIAGTLSYRGNLNVMLFLYVFSGLVGIIRLSGGVEGFAAWMKGVVRTSRGALLATWALEPITFIDCGFRVVAAGAVMGPVARGLGVSRERMAMMLNNSASPVISLIPVATTYLGYIIGLLAQGMRTAGVTGSAFTLFLRTIPVNFFSWSIIAVSIGSILLTRHQTAPAPGAPPHALSDHAAFQFETSGELGRTRDTAKDQSGLATRAEHKGEAILPPRPANLLVPVLLLIIVSVGLILVDGWKPGRGMLDIFAAADASRMMLLALFITTLIAAGLYLAQGVNLKGLVDNFVKGGNNLMVTIIILGVAWPIADVSTDLGLPRLVRELLATRLAPWLIPVLVFGVTAVITYFIGSSWGAWALMMPLALPLAAASGAPLYLAAAAVLSGGTFGDITSPLSGMTAMSAGVVGADHGRYIRMVLPYSLTAAAMAAVLFTGAGYLLG